jgi:PAS domain S-box-containing protein/diguanylate cyclase (GGDEF)-like protein
MQPQAGNRISNAIAKASGALAAILGFIALAGWIMELPVLASLGHGWIPMAPSSALLFVLLGTTVFFSTRVPPSRAAYRVGIAIGSVGALIALLLFFLSYLGIRLDAEHLGIAIVGSVGDSPIGHISPATALCFALAGLSLVATLTSYPDRRGQAMAGFWLAGLLVFASIVILIAYLFGTPLLYGGKFIPPALTTGLALAALGAALLALAGSRAWASDQQIDAETLRASRSFVLVFALMTMGLVTAGGVYHRSHVKQHRAEVERELSAIADLKVSELVNWRGERFGDAMLLHRNTVFADLLRRALGSAPDAQARYQLHSWLRQIREAYGYEVVSLIDAQGVAQFSVPEKALIDHELETARQVLRSGQVTLDDFHQDEPGGAPNLSLLVPILDDAAGRPLGIVLLGIDPAKYLYPLIERSPSLSSTGETLLVRRDGDDVLYLNELRFQKNTALSLRFPLTRTELPAAKAVLGQEGIVEGMDYRGVPAIAALRAVPGTPWFLVARINTEEFLASIQESLWLMAGLVAALLLFSGGTLGFIWRHQRVRHYSERTQAAEALAAGAARYRAVTQTAVDAIVTADSSGIIVGWNASAERIFGYTETEVIGQPLMLLIPEQFQDRHLDGMKRMQSGGERRVIGKTVELVGRRKDASEFPLDLSLAEWSVGGGQFFTANIRDITERRTTEGALAQSELRFRQMAENIRDVFFLRDADGKRMLYISPAYEEIWGRSCESLYANPESWSETIHPDDRASAYEKNSKGMLAGKFDFEYRIVRSDGSIRWIETRGFPVRDDAGKIVRIAGVAEDITERKQAEEEIRVLAKFPAENPNPVIRIGRNGTILYANQSSAPILARWGREVGEDIPDDWQKWIAPTIESGITKEVEIECNRRIFSCILAPILAEEYLNVYGRDITERTQATQALRESRQRLDGILTTAMDAIVTVDDKQRIVMNNPAAEKMFGYTVAEFQGMSVDLLMPERFRAAHPAHIAAFGKTGATNRSAGALRTVSGLRKNGEVFPIEASISKDDSTGRQLFTAILRDITERKEAESRIAYLNRVYAMLSGINTLIVRVRDRDELFREACRIAVEVGGFPMSWICIVDRSSMKIVPVASAGVDEAFLTAIKSFLSSSEGTPEGNNMVARAIKEKTVVVSNDLQSNPMVVFGKKYAESGIHSAAFLPLIVADDAVGMLALFTNEIEFFQEEELKLLTELTGDIAYAIDHIGKQERLDYLAYYDALTGLANRTLFLERVAQYLRSAVSGGHKLAVALIDLERFKNINDSLGRPAGDALLRQVAEWLTRITGDTSLLARVGADHFAGVLPQVKQGGDVARLLEKTMQAFLDHPFHLNDGVFRIAAKVGVALFPDDGADADTLFRNAEAALKKAKASGDRYLFYAQKMTEMVADKLNLENQLRQALDKGEFVLHYQPKVSLASGKLTSAEALIRWNDPRTGLVPPGRFIPILEETGLIYEVGRWALRQAIKDYLRWLAAGLPAVRIAVNVSPLQLRNRGFIDEIRDVIAIDAQAAAGLELEITESLIMEDVKHNIASLGAIRDLGVSIAIDDFGTGFSSLSYLAKLPVDSLKIDRSFVIDMTTGPQGLSLVTTIINLAHSLKLKVVAEGVETEEQSGLLRLLNCDEMQGFLFSKPVPSDIFKTRFLVPPPTG